MTALIETALGAGVATKFAEMPFQTWQCPDYSLLQGQWREVVIE